MSSWREPSKHLVGGAGVGAGAATGARMEDQREGQRCAWECGAELSVDSAPVAGRAGALAPQTQFLGLKE